MSGVTLRPATAADVPRLSDLVRAASAQHVDRLGRPPRPMTDDYADVVRTHRVIVAERGGEIVGLVGLGSRRRGLFVDNVAVDPAHRGTGVGRALLEHAASAARDAGFDSLYLTSTRTSRWSNLALNSRIGYAEYDRPLHGEVRIVYLRKEFG